MSTYVLGIDIGGTRIKLGVVDTDTGAVIGTVQPIDTPRDTEAHFYEAVVRQVDQHLASCGLKRSDLAGMGVSIGSYCYADGSIDGMSSFVPFMVEGYPLLPRLEEALGLKGAIDNDARLIGMAETHYGAGVGYKRTLTMTLGTGVGIGICVDGKPMGEEAFFHLSGHVKVRTGGEFPNSLDKEPCYCGMQGCFESTCSGTSLELYLKDVFGPEMTNKRFFELAKEGDPEALRHLNWYLDMVSAALNQYVYLYCPDVIIMGGGVSKGLAHWKDELQKRLVGQVHHLQKTEIVFSRLMEDSGVLGAASLFAAVK